MFSIAITCFPENKFMVVEGYLNNYSLSKTFKFKILYFNNAFTVSNI